MVRGPAGLALGIGVAQIIGQYVFQSSISVVLVGWPWLLSLSPSAW